MRIKIESFPSNLIANSFGFTQEQFFEVTDAVQKESVKMEF